MSSTYKDQKSTMQSADKGAAFEARPVTPAKATINDFLELARLWKPAGILGFHIPLVVGVLASIITESTPLNYTNILVFNLQTLSASLFQRSAACAWNDAADYEFDRQVARTRNRPIARGSVSPGVARSYAAYLTLAWFLCVWPSGEQAMWTLVPNFLFNVAYPFMKRITYYPQVFLGFTTCWNVLTGYAMATQLHLETSLQDSGKLKFLGYLMLAEAAFNGFYDTIYAYQDFADDRRAGVRSVTLKWGDNGKIAIGIMAMIEVFFLALAGSAVEASFRYYALACGGSALLAVIAVVSCDLNVPEDCGLWFKQCIFYGAIIQFSGFMAEYVYRLTQEPSAHSKWILP